MHDFSSYIGIIGGGISGLTLGCSLRKYGINTIIFEKEPNLHDEGAGISISPNGLIALEHLDLKNELEKNSYKSSKVIFAKAVQSEGIKLNPNYKFLCNDWVWAKSLFKKKIRIPNAEFIRNNLL